MILLCKNPYAAELLTGLPPLEIGNTSGYFRRGFENHCHSTPVILECAEPNITDKSLTGLTS